MDLQRAYRLLQASILTHRIAEGGAQSLDAAASAALSDIGIDPTTVRSTVRGGSPGIDACFYGKTTNGDGILAFRGTLKPHLALESLAEFRSVTDDWLQDTEALPIPGTDLPGFVHTGFRNALDDLWPAIADWNLGATPRLYVTGHSKGGALAHLAACRLAATGIPVTEVYSFAAPRAGDGAFVAAFNNLIPACWRFEYQDDLVPHLPPETGGWLTHLGDFQSAEPTHVLPTEVQSFVDQIERIANFSYASAGTLQFLNWSDPSAIETTSFFLPLRRNLRLAQLVAEGQLMQIVGDHAATGGYTAAIGHLASV
jgi:hypothetical protein